MNPILIGRFAISFATSLAVSSAVSNIIKTFAQTSNKVVSVIFRVGAFATALTFSSIAALAVEKHYDVLIDQIKEIPAK